MTTKKKLIGYGYTDSDGVATLDYNENGTEISTLAPTGSSGYIGRGVGSVQLEAGLHSSETVVSGTLPVLDCSFYDKGTSDSPSPKVVNFQNALKITRGSEGTLVEKETTYNGYYLLNQTSADEYPYDVNFCIEFDITQVTGEVGLSYAQGNWRGTMINIDGTGHYKIECTDTYQKIITPRGQVQYDHTYSANTSLRLQFYGISSVEYNNFKIYPI